MRSTFRTALRCALAAGSVLLAAGILSADARSAVSVSTYDRLPLTFEPNRGQAAPEARFLSRSSGYNLLLGTTGATLVPEAGGMRGCGLGSEGRPGGRWRRGFRRTLATTTLDRDFTG